MASSDNLDEKVGQVVATLPDGTEYRQVLLDPAEGETHVTPDERTWLAMHEAVVDGKVITSPFTIHWKATGASKFRTVVPLLTPEPRTVIAESAGERQAVLAVSSKPSLSYGGGPLLQNVQVQAVFWGSYWKSQSSLIAQIDQFFTFV